MPMAKNMTATPCAALSESNVTAGVQGGWDKKFDVWDTFIVGGSPDVISVTPDTPYHTLTDLIEAAKKNPGSIKARRQRCRFYSPSEPACR